MVLGLGCCVCVDLEVNGAEATPLGSIEHTTWFHENPRGTEARSQNAAARLVGLRVWAGLGVL